MAKPIITLTSDFGIQSQGVGNMEGAIININPDANVIHLMHGLPSFDLSAGARTMETLLYMPVGFHVCVVDPGVGTSRKPIIIQTGRGDFLVGPDNGVLIPAAKLLGGIVKAVHSTNEKYMRHPVSPIFHGRDIFSPNAAHLSNGVPIEDFGPAMQPDELISPPYEEAYLKDDIMRAKIIHINKFGSIHLNILHKEWDAWDIPLGTFINFQCKENNFQIPFKETFGQVQHGDALILKDDYGRIAIAINQGSFSARFHCNVGDTVLLQK